MPVDNSRQRSMYFLILATLRKHVSQSNDVPAARELAKNLNVIENEDYWEIVTMVNSERISTTVPKTNFKFYATKDASAYEVEPSQLNASSARLVVEKLFDGAGIVNSQFSVNIKTSKQTLKSFPRKVNTFQVPILFIFSLLMHLELINLAILPYLRVVFAVYVVINFIGKKKMIENLSKYVFILITIGGLAFLAEFNLSTELQLIFVGQIFLIEILNYSRSNLVKGLFLIAISICTNFLLLANIGENFTRPQMGVFMFSLSVFFLNFSKCLKIRTKTRQISLLVGLLLVLIGLILWFSFSLNIICGILFIVLFATVAQLTSGSVASTKIYVPAGLVI